MSVEDVRRSEEVTTRNGFKGRERARERERERLAKQAAATELVSIGHLLCELFHLQLTADNGPDALIALAANSADCVPGRFALDRSGPGHLNLPARLSLSRRGLISTALTRPALWLCV